MKRAAKEEPIANNDRSDGLRSTLHVYRLPEDASSQQPLIERAEEDLLCAVTLYHRGACGYLPLVTTCYLLHQALEKWLKLLIAVRGISVSAKGPHDLYNRIVALEKLHPEFKEIRKEIEGVDPMLMDQKFPGNLRYNEIPTDIEQYIKALMSAVFRTRRLARQYLDQEDTP